MAVLIKVINQRSDFVPVHDRNFIGKVFQRVCYYREGGYNLTSVEQVKMNPVKGFAIVSNIQIG